MSWRSLTGLTSCANVGQLIEKKRSLSPDLKAAEVLESLIPTGKVFHRKAKRNLQLSL